MSNEPVTNENVTDELQDDYEIPIRYIEEDDWEDLPHPPEHFRDKTNGE